MEYKELNLHEHVLKRPDTYVGSIRPEESIQYITENENQTSIVKKEIIFTPALLRIFIEALSNAVDNVWRSIEFNTPCKSIKININSNEITVWNDGLSIPIRKHESGRWIPDMLFGRLLTSSNFQDNEERYTSGRNGLGISLTNIFSSVFQVIILDPQTNQLYNQQWENNMKKKSDPIILKKNNKNGFTQVKWIPDFEYFNLNSFSDDFINLMYRYVIDASMIVGNNGVKVYLNNKQLSIHKFKNYAKLYSSPLFPEKEILTLTSPQSECIILPSNQFEIISFVNGVYTKDGGVHVNAWCDIIFKNLSQKINKKFKTKLSVRDIKPYFKIFVTCNVPNPEFSSQSKHALVSPSLIGVEIQNKHILNLMKWSFIESLKNTISEKELKILKNTESTNRVKKIDGFDPANKERSKDSYKCTLILCEGLSAKTYAVCGIKNGCYYGDEKLKGRDWFGIMPIKGKLLNVRKVKTKSISENKVISNIVQALGVRYDVDYGKNENYNKLRYGRIMFLCDQDVDGYHIQGLLINMLHYLFPTLFKRHGFITCMHTPIMKITLGRGVEHRFYNLESAKIFITNHNNKRLKIKYYKGLGTSNDKDVLETFGEKIIIYNNDEDTNYNLNMIFGKDKSNYRKEWIENYKNQNSEINYINNNTYTQNISDFLNYDLIKYSQDDCKRSLPNIMDGFKESQRKILYACFLKDLKNTIKVAQLAGFVAEKTNYHHGEMCLFETITKMAQNFIGSNNIPILDNDGQFGSRTLLGKDAASARYIFTKLSNITRYIFHPDDDHILTYISDDGTIIEPEFYIPIIPLLLINGVTCGIGTGWSSTVPCYNPIDIINWIKVWLNNEEETIKLIPWYRGFKGTIKQVESNKYETFGVITQQTSNLYIIDEIPIGMSIENFKFFLEDLLISKNIKSLKNYSEPNKVLFEIKNPTTLGIKKIMNQLKSYITTTNLVMFNDDNKICKFQNVDDIMNFFCKNRLKYYLIRKQYLIKKWEKELNLINNKWRFLDNIMNNIILIHKQPEEIIIQTLEELNFEKIDSNYDYLLSMPIKNFSKQYVEKLQNKMNQIKSNLEILNQTDPKEIWLKDLQKLQHKLQHKSQHKSSSRSRSRSRSRTR